MLPMMLIYVSYTGDVAEKLRIVAALSQVQPISEAKLGGLHGLRLIWEFQMIRKSKKYSPK